MQEPIKAGVDGAAVATGLMALFTNAVPIVAGLAAIAYTLLRIADLLHEQRKKHEFPFGGFGKDGGTQGD